MNKNGIEADLAHQNRIWRHYQNIHPESFKNAEPRMDYIIRQILKKSCSKKPCVLNIGAGSGYLENRLRQLGTDIHTMDPDEMTVRRLSENGFKSHWGYIEQMPFDGGQFDFVIASEVLEHLNKHQFNQGLKEVFRMMKPNGWFIGTVPFNEDLVLNHVICPDCGHLFHRWGHVLSFNCRTLNHAMTPFFEKILIKKTAFIKKKGIGWTGTVKSIVRLILARFGSAIASPNIFFMAQKR